MALAVLSAASIASTSAVTLRAVPTKGQILSYTQGAPTVISSRASIASVTVYPETNGHIVLFVAGRNQTTANINFGIENVSAAANGKALRVFTYDELAKKVKSRAMWGRIAAGAGSGWRAGAANQPTQTTYGGTYNGSTYDNANGHSGNFSGNFIGSSTTIDPTAQALAQSAIIAEARAQGTMLNTKESLELASLRRVLRTTTVQPGQIYGGFVEIARPPASSVMNVQLYFAGERHLFSFQVSR